MKKNNKPIIVMLLTIILILSFSVISFAGDIRDPIGHSMPNPIYIIIR